MSDGTSATRRDFLKTGLTASLALAGSQSPLQANEKEDSKVWLDMTQAELDFAYDQLNFAPNLRQIIDRQATNSQVTRNETGEPISFSYGTSPIETLDIFKTDTPNAPIHIYIHGGTWRFGEAKNFAFPAETFTGNGVHYVVLNFAGLDSTGGDLSPLVKQVRSAIAWVYRNANRFEGDPENIYISGHSSGGHLAGTALTTDWEKDYNIPSDSIKGALCISGIYDLKPVRISSRREYVNISDEIEHLFSAQRHIEKINTPTVIAYGTLESPEFIRQSEELASALKSAGKQAELLVCEGYNHFEILDTLANPYGLLGRAVLRQIQSTAS